MIWLCGEDQHSMYPTELYVSQYIVRQYRAIQHTPKLPGMPRRTQDTGIQNDVENELPCTVPTAVWCTRVLLIIFATHPQLNSTVSNYCMFATLPFTLSRSLTNSIACVLADLFISTILRLDHSDGKVDQLQWCTANMVQYSVGCQRG